MLRSEEALLYSILYLDSSGVIFPQSGCSGLKAKCLVVSRMYLELVCMLAVCLVHVIENLTLKQNVHGSQPHSVASHALLTSH